MLVNFHVPKIHGVWGLQFGRVVKRKKSHNKFLILKISIMTPLKNNLIQRDFLIIGMLIILIFYIKIGLNIQNLWKSG